MAARTPSAANGRADVAAASSRAEAFHCGAGGEELAGSLSAVLGSTGLVLLSAGVVWGVTQVLGAHPYLLLIGLGLAGLAASALSRPGGVPGLLPDGLAKLLLRSTAFDLLHDDYDMQNLVRKWGRLLYIALRKPSSEDEIAAVLEGLDPEFVDAVFRKSLLEWLPPPAVRLLSPEPLLPAVLGLAPWPPQHCEEVAPAGLGAPAALKPPPGAAAAANGPGLLRPSGIVQILKAKDEERSRLITEPEIVPAKVIGVAIAPLLSAWARWARLGAQGLAAVGLAYVGVPRLTGLLRGCAPALTQRALAACGGASEGGDGAGRVARAAPAAAGVLATGVSVAFCAITGRRWLGQFVARAPAGAPRTGGPAAARGGSAQDS